MWQVIVLTFGAVLILRLICAPVWIYREQAAQIEASKSAETLEAAEERRHWERLNSEAKNRLVMQGRGWLARYVGKIQPVRSLKVI